MAEGLYRRFNEKPRDHLYESGFPVSTPESTLENQEPFAKRIEISSREILPGLQFEQKPIDLGEGFFSNSFDISFKSSDDTIQQPFVVNIESNEYEKHLGRHIKNDTSVVASVNGGFFFLANDAEEYPSELAYNLIIRDGSVCGLPVADRPAILNTAHGLEVGIIKAKGTLNIAGSERIWIGAKNFKGEKDFILFNSACCVIDHIKNGDSTRRVLNIEKSKTPLGEDLVDICIEQEGSRMIVKKIQHGGGSNVVSYNFILQGTESDVSGIKEGDVIEPTTLDERPISDIRSGLTIGPPVMHFLENDDHEINHDTSLGSKPPFSDRRMARSIIYKDATGQIHVRVFDGAPQTNLFAGVTPREVAQILRAEYGERGLEWAYHLDPGQSARLVIRDGDQYNVFGNQHYIRWPKLERHPYVWAGQHGRAVPSALVIRSTKSN
jgi:Phosphodiester glycosidase